MIYAWAKRELKQGITMNAIEPGPMANFRYAKKSSEIAIINTEA
jgi:NAD(P)-dependent dehydrogenase (short-subunit alcohol dehydrogenase family)